MLLILTYFVVPPESSIKEFLVSPVKYIGTERMGVFVLLALQAGYLIFDVMEASQEKVMYGIIGATFMTVLGLAILIIALIDSKKAGHLHIHSLVEGLFYTTFGISLLVLRIRNYNKE